MLFDYVRISRTCCIEEVGSNGAILHLDFVDCVLTLSFRHLFFSSVGWPGSPRPLGLQVELVVPNGSRPLVFLGGSSPPGKQAELWPKECSEDLGLRVEVWIGRWNPEGTGKTSGLLGLPGAHKG